MTKFPSKITVLVSYNVYDNVYRSSSREFPIAPMLNPFLKSLFM